MVFGGGPLNTLKLFFLPNVLLLFYQGRGGAAKHVSYSKCLKYYNGNAAENTLSAALDHNSISIIIFSLAPALECIFSGTW